MGKAVGGLWFGSIGPADIAGPAVLIRMVNVANLRTTYFLDRERKSKLTL